MTDAVMAINSAKNDHVSSNSNRAHSSGTQANMMEAITIMYIVKTIVSTVTAMLSMLDIMAITCTAIILL